MAQGGGRHLEVGVGGGLTLVREVGGESTVDLGDGSIEGQDRDGGEHPVFDRREVPVAGRRPPWRFLEAVDQAKRLIEVAPERHPVNGGTCVGCSCDGSPTGSTSRSLPRPSALSA